jgi:hypothetical protein
MCLAGHFTEPVDALLALQSKCPVRPGASARYHGTGRAPRSAQSRPRVWPLAVPSPTTRPPPGRKPLEAECACRWNAPLCNMIAPCRVYSRIDLFAGNPEAIFRQGYGGQDGGQPACGIRHYFPRSLASEFEYLRIISNQQGAHPGQNPHQPEDFQEPAILFAPFFRQFRIPRFDGQGLARKQERIDSRQDWNQAVPLFV